MKIYRYIAQIARDERGASGFTLLWVCFVILLLTPFLWDIASVQFARRFAGTGADAAALAAAQEYARALQYAPAQKGQFRGSCERKEFRPQDVTARYRDDPAFSAPPDIGAPLARRYATENRSELMTYRSWPDYSAARMVDGVPVPAIRVYVETRRRVATAYRPLDGRTFQVPNRALAIVYLDRSTRAPRICEGEASGQRTYDFTYVWKIALDQARG